MTTTRSTAVITSKLLNYNIKYASDHGVSVSLSDSEVRGFSARISPTGRVTWLASKSFGKGKGSTKRVVVGHYPGMSLDEARLEAGAAIVRMAKGEDVQSQVKAAKRALVESRQCPTIKEASSDWLSQRSGDPTSRYEIEVRQLFERQVVPELGLSTRVNEVSKADIRKMLSTRRDKGHSVAARNLFAQLRPFFSWCVHEEMISVSPCDGVVPPDAAKERQHKLTDAEIVALWSCAIPYFKVLLLTAQRRTEVASMQWQEVNLNRREWIIPPSKTKNGREHLVPLSPLVVSILNGMPSREPRMKATPSQGERSSHDYVFSKYADAPFSGYSKATAELQEASKVTGWRIHDLRRTAASGMASLRVQPHVIEAVLNHTPVKLQRTYQVWQYADEKREALELWADHLTKLASPNASNVTQIRSRKFP